MLTRLYIEALLLDEEAADRIWGTWNAHEIDDFAAACGWLLIAFQARDNENIT